MPLVRSRRLRRVPRDSRWRSTLVPLAAAVIGALTPVAFGSPDTVLAIRSRRAALEYRLVDATPATQVELWYTRDRAATWSQWGIHADHAQPLVFDAPAEGLYGFVLIARDGEEAFDPPPAARAQPQCWVFIDYTPPLVQWDSVEPAGAFASRRIVHLGWTAHDDNLPRRPVALSYQSSVDQMWYTIDAALPNTGRYDWQIPVDLAGQVTLKLAVRDLGGHVVERQYGPVPLDRWLTSPVVMSPPATRPADDHASGAPARVEPRATTRPSLAARQRAEQLYQRGSWHLLRGQHPVAAERFREALEIEPDLLEAWNDLAGIYYLQKDYAKAVEHYNEVLKRDEKHQAALWGAALAYVAQRQYAQSRAMLERLLAADDKNAEAWLDLGDVLFMTGSRAEALSAWSRAAEVDASAADVIGKAQRRLTLRPGPRGGDR